MSVTRPVISRVTSPVVSRVTDGQRRRGATGVNFASLLFSADEVGASYEIWRPETLFQDVTGTQPVTASGQTVRLMLDASKGLVRGSELVVNGDFSDGFTGWSSLFGAGWGEVDGKASITESAGGLGLRQSGLTLDESKYYLIEYDLEVITGGHGLIRFGGSGGGSQIAGTAQTTSGRKRVIIRPSGGTTEFIIIANNGATLTVDNVTIRELPGNHAYQADAGKAPVYTVADGLAYLLFDGVDDFLETAAIDFTATDEMTVFAGVRKLSDAARGTIAELSATIASSNGAFHLAAPNAASATFAWESKGTTLREAIDTGIASPATRVLTAIGDISGDIARLRINGVQGAEDLGDQGTGNYGNHKLYIGMRAGTSFPFNGPIYGLTIRGAETPLETIQIVEAELAKRTGITL